MSIKLYLLVYLLISSVIFSQNETEEVIATIGSVEITESEFLERFELTPQFNRQIKNQINARKLDFLYTLIAEKLWALEAAQKNYDIKSGVETAKSSIEKMYVRDALYKAEITDKITVSDAEIKKGLDRSVYSLKVNFLYSTDENEIYNFYKLLKLGVPFDSILVERSEYLEQREPINVEYGDLQDNVEDSVFTLEIGEFTSPLITADGWYIFNLVDKNSQVMASKKEEENTINAVKKIIAKSKENELYRNFYINFFKNRQVDVDQKLFKEIFLNLHSAFRTKENYLKNKAPEDLIHFEVNDLLRIEHEMGNKKLSLPFLQFQNDPLTAKSFLRELIFDGFNSTSSDSLFLLEKFNRRVRTTIERELLAREGYRRGLHLLPDVKRSVGMWTDNYLFQVAKGEILDNVTVTDSAALIEYKRVNKAEVYPIQVNIIEVLTDSLELINKIRSDIDAGVDIKVLAAKFTKREWTKSKQGEFGFFPVTTFGEIGRIAAKMEIGDIYGPLIVPEGYSVFKLIDRKEKRVKEPIKDFELEKEKIKRNLAENIAYEEILEKTVSFAERNKIEINYKKLQAIKVSTINSFAIRQMGFGGKITAVPLLAPFTEWVNEWLKQKQDLP
jgi:parvulin-like peptidyl-prolyl isomerase